MFKIKNNILTWIERITWQAIKFPWNRVFMSKHVDEQWAMDFTTWYEDNIISLHPWYDVDDSPWGLREDRW